MIRKGLFTLELELPGSAKQPALWQLNDHSYLVFEKEDEYQLCLRNQGPTETDADVRIDGERVGIYRLLPHERVVIDRPVNVARKFKLMKEKSAEAQAAGVQAGLDLNGVIEITFKPEKTMRQSQQSWYQSCDSLDCPPFAAATALGGTSNTGNFGLFSAQGSTGFSLSGSGQGSSFSFGSAASGPGPGPVSAPFIGSLSFGAPTAATTSAPAGPAFGSYGAALGGGFGLAGSSSLTPAAMGTTSSPGFGFGAPQSAEHKDYGGFGFGSTGSSSTSVNGFAGFPVDEVGPAAAATVLGDASSQTFTNCRKLWDIDWSNQQKIVVRLMIRPSKSTAPLPMPPLAPISLKLALQQQQWGSATNVSVPPRLI